MASPGKDRRPDRGRLARLVLAWGTLAGLLASTLPPTISEPEPALMLGASEPTPLPAVVVEPGVPPTLVPTAAPAPTAVVALAAEPATPIDVAVAGVAQPWLVRVQRGARIGSGFIVGADGLIVTSDEVVDGYAPIRVWLPDGQTLYAEILWEDADQALALLAVPVATPAVAPLVAGTDTEEPVLLVGSGSQAGEPPVITQARLLAEPDQTLLRYRTAEPDPVAQPAGSPLLDAAGAVVGLATRPGQIGVGVPAGRVLAFIKEGEATWRAASRGPVQSAASAAPRPAMPSLLGRSVEQSEVDPGASLTLTYDIVNPGADGQPVVLGASVRRDTVQAWIDDPANDAAVVVQPGRATYRREFRLPNQARSGWYEVAWSILSPDKAASYAFDTAARVVRVRPVDPGPAATVTPRVASAADNVSPPADVARPSIPLPTPTVRRPAVAPPRPTATPTPRVRPSPKPTPSPTPVPRRAPTPTPVRRR
jgi:S1-C subfamily serine protease